MKKLFMVISLALMVSTMSYAQEAKGERQHRQFDKSEMIKMRTERTAKELGLTAAQTDSLLAINTEFADVMGNSRMPMRPHPQAGADTTKVKSIRDMVTNKREQMAKYEMKVKALLTPEQLAKYQTLKRNRMSRPMHRQGVQGRPGQGMKFGKQNMQLPTVGNGNEE